MSGPVAAERRQWWRHPPAVVVAAVGVVPVVAMAAASLRAPGTPPPRTLELVPADPTLAAYPRAFELQDLSGQLLSSSIVAAVAVPLTLLVASWAGFAIAQAGRRARALALAASFVALMVPATALLVSRLTIYRSLGVTDTYVPLVAPALLGTSPFFVLLYAWSFWRIPHELFEAARLEGLGPLGTWRRVAMPLVRPVTAAVAVLAFVVTWGNLLDPLVYLSDPDLFTLPVGLRQLSALDRTDQSVVLAAAVVATVPVVVAFLAVQRWFLGNGPRAGWWR